MTFLSFLQIPMKLPASTGSSAKPDPGATSNIDPAQFFTTAFWMEAAFRAVEIALIIFVILIFRFILYRIITRTMNAIVERQESVGRTDSASRARTLGGLLRSVTAYLLAFIGLFMILSALGAPMGPLLTTAGVLGLAVGFGAQKLVKDVIAGFFILLENQYAVGDYVTIGTFSGVVEGLGMRTTSLRDDIGRLIIISNGDISAVTNHSRGALTTSVEVPVAPGSDLAKVCDILREVGVEFAEEREDVLTPFTCDGVAAMDGTRVTLRMIGQVRPDAQQQVQLDLRRRVRDALVAKDVQIA